MNRKLIAGAAGIALTFGAGFGQAAFADDDPATGHCSEIEGTSNPVVGLYGQSPENEGEGCLVAEGKGAVPVNPVDDGHIGVYDGGDAPALYGDCSPRGDGAGFTKWDPTAGGTDTNACKPA